ncbi:hypothetical protein ACF0H5_017548 [Mactra antiquata]
MDLIKQTYGNAFNHVVNQYTVLVTGGSGFLGQHVVGLLQTRADHVTNIRVLDVIDYENKTDYDCKKPVEKFIGDILDEDLVIKACTNVDCVIHLASIIDISLFADYQRSYRINILGTKNIIEACKKTGVKRLIYCSSASVVYGPYDIIDGHEDELIYPEEPMLPVYAETKQQAETLVLQSNSDTLQTVSLRPVSLYGDQDYKYLAPFFTNKFTRTTGYLLKFEFGSAKTSQAYVGNVAWAFIQADNALRESKSPYAAGLSYFIRDETPNTTRLEYDKEVLRETNIKLFPCPPPVWLQSLLLRVIFFILYLISPIRKFNFPIGDWALSIRSTTWLFSYSKAQRQLGFKPIYSPVESRKRLINFINSALSDKNNN